MKGKWLGFRTEETGFTEAQKFRVFFPPPCKIARRTGAGPASVTTNCFLGAPPGGGNVPFWSMATSDAEPPIGTSAAISVGGTLPCPVLPAPATWDDQLRLLTNHHC